MADSAAAAAADKLIHDNAVMIFSKTYCPHCRHSKSILTAKQKEYEGLGKTFSLRVCELDEIDGGSAMQDHLASKTGARTVPRIFIAEESLGGRSDLDDSIAAVPGASSSSSSSRSLDDYWLKKAVEYTTKTSIAAAAPAAL